MVKVDTVLDGDTILLEDGRQVRLLGINTPERGRQYYAEATNALKELIEDKEIELETDSEDEDQYGRILRYVHVDDTNVNQKLIDSGFSNSYFPGESKRYEKSFDQAESNAVNKGVGMWDHSPHYGCITIKEFHYDAQDNDCSNLNDEYVTFTNLCDNIVMTSWFIKDEANHFYIFPDVGIYSGGEFTLYTGQGQNIETSLYWNNKAPGCSAVWNNDRDSLYMWDENGKLVLVHKYN